MDDVKAEEFRVVSVEHAESIDRLIADRDAQRLRADTAEAELAKLRERHDTVKCQRNDATKVLAAAEQRIVELWQLVEKAYDHETIDGDWIEEYRRLKMSDAALNPKPEAGSHDRNN